MTTYTKTNDQVNSGAGSVSVGMTPIVAGRLRVIVAMERSGNSSLANYSCVDNSDSGRVWNKATGYIDTDATYRRTCMLFWRVSLADDNVGATVTDGSGNTISVVAVEYSTDAGAWYLVSSGGAGNGLTANATSQAVTTSGSVPDAGDKLVIGAHFIKRGGVSDTATISFATISLTLDRANEIGSSGASNGRGIGVGSARVAAGGGAGTVSTTASWTSGSNTNNGLASLIVVFSDTEPVAPPPSSPLPILVMRPMMQGQGRRR